MSPNLFLCQIFWHGQQEKGTDFKAVEPNGYLQWDEVNPEAKYIARTDPTVLTPALENLFMKFSIPSGEGGVVG